MRRVLEGHGLELTAFGCRSRHHRLPAAIDSDALRRRLHQKPAEARASRLAAPGNPLGTLPRLSTSTPLLPQGTRRLHTDSLNLGPLPCSAVRLWGRSHVDVAWPCISKSTKSTFPAPRSTPLVADDCRTPLDTRLDPNIQSFP